MAPGRVEVLALAAAVRSGERGAREVVAETLAGIAARNGAINRLHRCYRKPGLRGSRKG
jgi:Asp-tRNA(Asn)/Glu-tRNA(Gln) amidotransferase A subunit family amidase